jgi:hypothetical protein
MPGAPVLVGPAYHCVPASVRQFLASLGAVTEGERHTKGACNGLIRFRRIDGDQAKLPIGIELAVATRS